MTQKDRRCCISVLGYLFITLRLIIRYDWLPCDYLLA